MNIRIKFTFTNGCVSNDALGEPTYISYIYGIRKLRTFKTKTMIKVNPTNSILINGNLFITNLKATRVAVEKSLRKYLNYTNKVKHPKFGEMVQYTGFYNRNIIHL